MSMLVEPGTRLAGRYQLQERVSEVDGTTLWRAVDEPLARAVAVRTFSDDAPRKSEVIAAARAASRVTDSRFAQVFDADDSGDHAYLVSEWVNGRGLLDLLSGGPPGTERAVVFAREAIAAMASAHAAGLAHRRLMPSCLTWAKGGTVKITGLAVDAVLHGVCGVAGVSSSPDSAVADARALGAVLYAALTGRWPGQDDVGLPPAPQRDGVSVPVSEVLAGDVPDVLDRITERALGRAADGESSLDSPEAVREALTALPRLKPSTTPPAQYSPTAATSTSTGAWDSSIPGGPEFPTPTEREEADTSGRRPMRAVLLSLVAVLVLSATALGAWLVGRMLDDSDGDPAPPGGGGSSPRAQPLSVQAVDGYDPMGDQEESSEDATKANDGQPGTVWPTETYTSADLGGLKGGVGLVLDMGKPTSVRSVRLSLAGQGSTIELHAGGQPQLDAMQRVASVRNAGQQVQLNPKRPVQARYFVVWFTQLPQVSDGYRAEVAEISVRGTA